MFSFAFPMLFTMRWQAKRMTATSTPLLWAAAHGVEVRNWHGEDGGHNNKKEEKPQWQKECHRTTPTLITRGKTSITMVIRGQRPIWRGGQPAQDDNRDGDRDGQPQPHDQHSSGSAQWGGQQPWDKNQRCRWWIQCCMTRNAKRGPRDVVNISWAVGKFISCSFHFIGTNKVFRY